MEAELRAREVDRAQVGCATSPYVCEIEKGAIRRFAEAVGDLNPLYVDEAFARKRGHRSVVAPPTFAASLRPPEEPAWLRGIDRTRIIAGEQAFIHARPIVAGDVLTCRLHLVAIEDKTSASLGPVQVLTQEVRGIDERGALVFTHRRVSLVCRGRKSDP